MKASKHLVVFSNPNSPAAEAYRTLRTNISLRDFDNNMKVINVLSTNAAEGKSTTILNLAASFSQLDKKVLVIDLDLRLPTLHKKLFIKNTVGISDVCSHKVSFDEAVIHYAPNFDVLLSGTKTPFAAEFIQSKALKEFINSVKEVYDYVFIDCPPVGLVADGIIASEYCDGTILVVASNKDEKQELLRTKDQLEQTNVNILGIVMTRLEMGKKYYNYSYGYVNPNSKRKKK